MNRTDGILAVSLALGLLPGSSGCTVLGGVIGLSRPRTRTVPFRGQSFERGTELQLTLEGGRVVEGTVLREDDIGLTLGGTQPQRGESNRGGADCEVENQASLRTEGPMRICAAGELQVPRSDIRWVRTADGTYGRLGAGIGFAVDLAVVLVGAWVFVESLPRSFD